MITLRSKRVNECIQLQWSIDGQFAPARITLWKIILLWVNRRSVITRYFVWTNQTNYRGYSIFPRENNALSPQTKHVGEVATRYSLPQARSCRSGNMEKKSAGGNSLSRAVSAARYVMHSRTGVAILKQSYVTKQGLPGRSVQKIHEFKGKELRRLASERTQFISRHDEKLQPSPSSVRRTKGPHTTSSKESSEQRRRLKETSQLACQGESHSPSSVRKASDCKSGSGSPGKVSNFKSQASKLDSLPESAEKMKTPRELSPELEGPSDAHRKGSEREKDQSNMAGRISSTQKSEQRAKNEQGQFIGLTRGAYDRITEWIEDVDRANRTEPTTSNYDDFARTAIRKCESNSSLTLGDGEGKPCDALKLPKIEKPKSDSRSPRPTLKRFDALVDPRFTNLMEALTPAAKPLKLPSIAKEDPQRSSWSHNNLPLRTLKRVAKSELAQWTLTAVAWKFTVIIQITVHRKFTRVSFFWKFFLVKIEWAGFR